MRIASKFTALPALALAFAGCTVVALAAAATLEQVGVPIAAADFPRDNLLARAWVHWDAGWYAEIARAGYWYTPGHQSPVAFFPVYPSLIGALHALGLNRFWAGILVTAAAGCAGVWVFSRWANHLRGEAAGFRATTLLVLYPFAFYLYGVVYSDAVFLLVAAGAFYALEKDRLWLAVLLGAIATAARPVAPAIVVGLLARRIELRLARGERLRAVDFAPVLAGAGLAAYVAYLGFRFGDPLAFATVQSAPGWDQAAGPAVWLKAELFDKILHDTRSFGTGIRVVHGAVALAGLALAVPTWKRLGKGYALYVLVVIGIPALSSKDFMGLGRYAIAAFPLFLTVAILLEAKPKLRAAWLAVSAVGLVWLTIRFAAGHYVA